jgi:hypothetical protein
MYLRVRSLEEYKQVIIMGCIFLVLGLAFFMLCSSLASPSPFLTFLGIPYAVNPYAINPFTGVLFVEGFFFLGFGLGILLTAVYKLERPKIEGKTTEEKKYCRYCGTKINIDETFCWKCGKKID